MANRPVKKEIKYTALYYFVRFLIFLSGLMPRKAWLSLCGLLGFIAYFFSGQSRQRAITHLTMAFGQEKSPDEIRAICRRMFVMLGKNSGDVLRARHVETLAQLRTFLSVEGFENYEHAAAKGKGVIFLACHLGAFDLQVFEMALRGLKPNIIGTPLKDQRLNDLLFNYRNAHGAVAVERGKETMRLLRTLKTGGLVALLIDQDTKVKSRFVNFFGIPASSPVGAALLALKTGAPVVPTYIYLGDDGCQHMFLLPEIPLVVTGDEETDMIANTQRYNKFIEDRVREHPEQWVWMHERWKTKPGEEVR
jgi:KDO2-lipid IV(A) lauroyltransferase